MTTTPTTTMSAKLTATLLTTLVTTVLLLHPPPPAAAMDFHAMEDNCILSFVVPRDKVKSSCDMEERVTRRLNAMETKVTLYKQHVQELQEQLSKERQLHRHRLDELQELLAHSQGNPPGGGGGGGGVLQDRVSDLEEEVRKIRAALASSSSAAKPSPSPSLAEKLHGRGGVNLGVVPVGRTREEEEKAVTVLVKTVVRSEVSKLFDNYTQYVGRYVRDQALAFNQIINLVPRQDPPPPPSSFHHHNHLPPKWPNSKLSRNNDIQRGKKTTPRPPGRDAQLLNELEGIRNRLNSTGRWQNLLDNVRVNASAKANPGQVPDPALAPSPDQEHAVRDSGLLDINDTASGDANETAGDNVALRFTQLANDSDPAGATTSSPNVHVPANPDSVAGAGAGGKDVASAQSRMSYNADLNKLPDPAALEPGSGGSEGGGDKAAAAAAEGVPNVSGWMESMIHDQSTGQYIQELLRTEVRQAVAGQVEEVVSLVAKHSSLLDGQLHDQHLQFRQLEQRLAADIKHLSQVVSGLKLEVSSVSQSLQTLYSRVDRAEELEETVLEMKKNMSQEGDSRLLASLLDEQGKKVRKMERLTDIYKQSLEHYRNDTKIELRALKEVTAVELNRLRSQHSDLHRNLTEQARLTIQQLNTSTHRHLDDLKQRVQLMEDNHLLQQIDMSTLERQLKSKLAKAERDLDQVGGAVGDLRQKARGLQGGLNRALTDQRQLALNVSANGRKMQLLQIEVQLNVLDDWVPYEFDYMKTRTDCFGQQFIRKSGFSVGRLVGVVLCSHSRYKIFLGQSPVDTFKNIGDDSGMGEDHCQFVNARSMSKVKVSPFRTSTETEPGYVRTHWGQEPRPELLNIIRPSPAWYECGVSIP